MVTQTEISTHEPYAPPAREGAIASTTVIILVSDPDDPKLGEVTVLDDPLKAERVVETLLEAGYQQERFRVFSGNEREIRVSYKPVVSLSDGLAAAEAKESANVHEDPVERAADEATPEPGLGQADSTNGNGQLEPRNGNGQLEPRLSDFFPKSFEDAGY